MAFAQTFEQVLPPPPAPQILPNFNGVQNSSIAFADVDGDGDQDVLIAGGAGEMNLDPMGDGASAILYLNDGSGDYVEVTGTPFKGVQNGSVAFADVDGDGDQDVMITGGSGGMMGMPDMMEPSANLYLNDGLGNFTELLDTPFEAVQNSSIAFADIDKDGDQDVLITGISGNDWDGGVVSSNLYLNDGHGNYTKDNTNFFEGVQRGSIAFADVDKDGDQDVLITGIAGSEGQGIPASELYLNDGFGNFVEDNNTSFTGVGFSSIAFADIDGDNDQDVLIAGRDNNYNSIAKFYKNDGAGHYSESTGTFFEGVQNGSVAFADIDGDSDQDLLITGRDNNYNFIAKLYKNDGSGNYTEDINSSFAGVEYSSIAFADIDGDNDQDVLITGAGSSHNPIAKLYVNIGAGNFLEPTGTFFTGVESGSIAFADIDGDNDQDVLITGRDNSYNRFTKLYKNDSSGNYSEVTDTPFTAVENGSIAFTDVDKDGDQDVLIIGRDNSYNRIAKLYKNDGSGNYSEVTGTPFTGVENGSIAFADIDGDGNQDVMITGKWGNSSLDVSAKLYKNDGSGNFSEVTGTPFMGVQSGSIAFADVDGDADQDVLITGRGSQYSNIIAKLYKNDGSGNYSEVTETPLVGVQYSSVAFADIDGDDDQDLLITGRGSSIITKLYKNDGSGNFTEVTNNSFPAVQEGSIAFADVDKDGAPDVVITGTDNEYKPVSKLYMNDSAGNFSEVGGLPFTNVQRSSIAFADIDGDNDKDVLLTGYDGKSPVSMLYRNTTITSTPPVVDETAPVVKTFSPVHQATGVPLQLTLSVTFDEAVALNSSGILTLEDTDGVVRTYDLSVQEDREKFTISEDQLTLSLKIEEDLPANATLSVGISSGFVKDEHENSTEAIDASSDVWTFTTTKLDQTINFPEISSKTYGDDKFILGDEKSDQGLTVTYTAKDPTVVSISGNQATILKAGVTQITATQEGDETHFEATPVTQVLTVSEVAITVTADAKSKKYGEEDPNLTYQITSGALIGTDKLTGGLTRVAGEDAGTYVIEQGILSLSSNYKLTYKSADFTINKAEAIITADAVQNFTYDGTVKNVSAKLNHSETALTYSLKQGYIPAGTYPITINAEETDNYLSASKDVDLVIEKAEIEGVVFADDSFVYDGTTHSIFVKNLPEGAKVKYENNDKTNAGTYKVTATVSQENYNDKVLTANLLINKAEAVITAEAVQTFTYDGMIKNVSAKLNHSESDLSYRPQQGYTAAGTYPVTISAEETDNYLSASKNVSLEIKNAEIEGLTFADDSFIYDGTTHSIFVKNLPEGAAVKYDNNGQVNAGTYKVTATVSQENFNDKVLTADLIIKKAEAVITAEAVQTFTYDGTVKNVSAKLNHSESDLSYSPQQGYTAAGTYPVTISAEETDNYLSASKNVSLEIKNAEIEGVVFEDGTFTYDGTTHSIFVENLPEGATVKYADNGQNNAGNYKVSATVSQENYNDKVLTANLVIKKAEAVITADATQTFTYDGTVKNVSAELNHEETKLVYTPAQGFTNVGTHDVTISAEETDNYLSASKEVSLKIENAEITGVAFENETFTYNGEVHSLDVTGLPEGAAVKYENKDQINAGTYKVTATISQENYNDKVLTANLVINKAEAVITADATQTFTYDGTVKNVSAKLNHEETALTYSPAQGYTEAGTYPIVISAEETDNYLSASKNVSLEIENAEIEGVVFEDDTFTYDGTTHSIFVENLPEGATVKYADNGQINAGNYKVSATVSQENYNNLELNADLVIKKAEAIITADATQTFTYDGTVQNVSAILNHEEAQLTFSPQQGYTAAGTYPVTISAEETDNYLSASKNVSLEIKNAEIEGVTFIDDSFVYDGTTHTIFVKNLPEGAAVKYENNDQINAGTYKVTATVSQENYNDEILTANLIINKAEAVITADATQTFTYDGMVKNVSAELNHIETDLSYSPQQGHTAAGTYPIVVSAEETANYLATSKEVSLVIENAEIEGVVFEDDTFIYDGTTHSIFVKNLPEGASVTYDNNGQINAGTYKVTATVSQENYNDLELNANLTIKKAEAVITADATHTFTYDGTVKNVSAKLNHSETALIYSPAQGYTEAGTYPIAISAEETANYLSASKEVSLVIENADIEGVTFADESLVYDGTAHGIYVTGLPEGASVTYDNNGKINAGTYKVTATVSQENFNDKVLTADLIIKKAEAVITAEATQTFTYDGTVKNVSAKLNHSETVLSYSPQQGYTAAGTYPVTISAEETENYLSASKNVSLEIENAEIEGVTFADASFVYDNTTHSIFVENLPEGATVKYADNEQINAGTYKVTATVSQENYNDKVLTADLTINKAEAVITAEAVQTFTYDGTIKNVSAKLNHEESALTYAPAQGFTNAGIYEVKISSEETENYLSASKEVSLVIEPIEIEGLSFEGATFTYDGQPHSLIVTGLPEGATVSYSNNGKTNAGTYTVTAIVSLENYSDKVLTAELIINKAPQSITFEELSDRNVIDDNFVLQATSSSGLPVTYSYTSEDDEPAATVSERGFVRLLAAGQISITAMQEGNQNYEAATPVIRTLNILNSTARLDKVVINGTSYSNPSAEIYYLIGCGSGEDQVQIQLEPNRGSSADHAAMFTIETPVPGIYDETIMVTSGDGNASRTYHIKVEKTFNFEDIVVQKFNNVLLVNNNPATNGGYKFESFRWYKNGALIGTGQYFSEGDNLSDQLDTESSYYVEMTTEDGEILRTCDTTVQLRSSFNVMLSPNPVNAGESLELFADFPKEELATMQLSIHNLNGALLKRMSSNRKTTTIELPYNIQVGVYILSIKTSKRNKSLKFIVR